MEAFVHGKERGLQSRTARTTRTASPMYARQARAMGSGAVSGARRTVFVVCGVGTCVAGRRVARRRGAAWC